MIKLKIQYYWFFFYTFASLIDNEDGAASVDKFIWKYFNNEVFNQFTNIDINNLYKNFFFGVHKMICNQSVIGINMS